MGRSNSQKGCIDNLTKKNHKPYQTVSQYFDLFIYNTAMKHINTIATALKVLVLIYSCLKKSSNIDYSMLASE
jgi:hypothetical protein